MIGTYAGLRVIEDATLLEHVGHWLPEIPFSRHRSKRIWKKLQRRVPARPMMEPMAYVIGGHTLVAHPSIVHGLKKANR